MSIPDMVRLPSGRSIPVTSFVFDPLSQRFFYGGQDFTNVIPRSVKLHYFTSLGFDVEQDNLRLYNEKNPGAPATGSISIWDNFWNQIATDPLEAPLATADQAVSRITDSTTGKILAVAAVAGVLWYFRDDIKTLLS